MKYTAFAHFVSLGATRYGADVDILKGGGDAAIIESYISAKTSSSHHMNPENLDERWLKVREIFEKFHFIPFDDKVCRHVLVFAQVKNAAHILRQDPALKMFPSWVSIEPRLLPLARRNGFGNADDWHEMVLKRIFQSSIQQQHPPEGEAAHVAKVILELTELDPAMYGNLLNSLRSYIWPNSLFTYSFVSRSLAGFICMEKVRAPHGYAALKALNSSNGLRFELRCVRHVMPRTLTS